MRPWRVDHHHRAEAVQETVVVRLGGHTDNIAVRPVQNNASSHWQYLKRNEVGLLALVVRSLM